MYYLKNMSTEQNETKVEFTRVCGPIREIGEFEGKTVYQCVVNYSIGGKHVSMEIRRFYMDDLRHMYHSINNTAAIVEIRSSSYYGGDSKSDRGVLTIYKREWYDRGYLYRSDGLPASETYHPNGNVHIQKWYNGGAIPTEGIIYREFNDDGLTVLKEFYAHQLDEYIKTSEEFKDMITFQEVNPGELVIL